MNQPAGWTSPPAWVDAPTQPVSSAQSVAPSAAGNNMVVDAASVATSARMQGVINDLQQDLAVAQQDLDLMNASIGSLGSVSIDFMPTEPVTYFEGEQRQPGAVACNVPVATSNTGRPITLPGREPKRQVVSSSLQRAAKYNPVYNPATQRYEAATAFQIEQSTPLADKMPDYMPSNLELMGPEGCL